MRLGIVADPLHTLKPKMDTTLLIAAEAHARGHEVRFTDYHHLHRSTEGAIADWHRLRYTPAHAADLMSAADDLQRESLDAFDIVTMRHDPPVSDRYLAVTYVLDGTDTPIVNDPAEVRDFNEKVSVLDLPDLCPPSLVSASEDEIVRFWQESAHGLILKPLNAFNGMGIERLDADMAEDRARELVRGAIEDGRLFTMAQHFVPAVAGGDKRFFLVDGEVIGRMNRVPAEGDYRANIHRGARPEQFEPSARDEDILAGVRDLMGQYDLPMVCIDVIGDFLTEINVTSPSGIPEINEIYGPGHEKPLVDLLERRAEEA
jgi:glutathione synthase